jgi:hypothetical protein
LKETIMPFQRLIDAGVYPDVVTKARNSSVDPASVISIINSFLTTFVSGGSSVVQALIAMLNNFHLLPPQPSTSAAISRETSRDKIIEAGVDGSTLAAAEKLGLDPIIVVGWITGLLNLVATQGPAVIASIQQIIALFHTNPIPQPAPTPAPVTPPPGSGGHFPGSIAAPLIFIALLFFASQGQAQTLDLPDFSAKTCCCVEGKVCICPNCDCYSAAYYQAASENKPLVMGIDRDPPTGEWYSIRVSAKDARVPSGQVIVSMPYEVANYNVCAVSLRPGGTASDVRTVLRTRSSYYASMPRQTTTSALPSFYADNGAAFATNYTTPTSYYTTPPSYYGYVQGPTYTSSPGYYSMGGPFMMGPGGMTATGGCASGNCAGGMCR